MKKRELILRPGTTFFKAFLKDYFAFFTWTVGKKDGKKEGRVKEEQRGLFLKEVEKKSKDTEKKRNEIN